MKNVINGSTMLCAVMGDPIGHTLSPEIHNYLAGALGVNMVYVPFHVRPEGLADSVKGAFSLGIQGMNVTIPHKEKIMAALSHIEEDAGTIGAVNTIVRTEEGYRGCNTDWSGLARALREEQIGLEGRRVLFLGAGGAANAAAYLCGREKAASVTILNRHPASAIALADRMGARFPDTLFEGGALSEWSSLPGQEYVCIQTTPVGMYPHTENAVVTEPAFYEKLSAAVDLIYRPGRTRYLQLAEKAGAKTCNGLLMFVYQAVEAFEKFTGVKVPPKVVLDARMLLERRLADEA